MEKPTPSASAANEAIPSPLIRSHTVKRMFGGVSDMTLWRWLKRRGFPKPQKIAGRCYWLPEAIKAWEDRNAV